MPNPDRPHGYNPDPDGRCYECRRREDAVVHTTHVIDLTRPYGCRPGPVLVLIAGLALWACVIGLALRIL